MFRYTLIQDDKKSDNRVMVSFDAIKLDQILMQMEHFLKGCGFYFEGILDISDPQMDIQDFPKTDVQD